MFPALDQKLTPFLFITKSVQVTHQAEKNVFIHPTTPTLTYACKSDVQLFVHAAAEITKAATAFQKVVANFINLFNRFLFDVSRMLTTAVVPVATTSFHVVVADFVKFFTRFVGVACAAFSVLFLALGWDFVSIHVKSGVVFTVFEPTAFTKGAFTVLFKVEARATWWVGNWFAFRVFVFTIVAIAAFTVVAECTAKFVGFHVVVRGHS